MFEIEEVFKSNDEGSRKNALEIIVASIIKNTKNHVQSQKTNDAINK